MADPEAPAAEMANLASSNKVAAGGVSAEGSGGADASWRVVVIGDSEASNATAKYPNNKVRTSKYTLLTFLPRNLWEQFHRVAYVYFAIIMILNQIPVLAVFGRTASLFPLLFVLIVTAIKDGYEDWGRRRSDRKVNAAHCSCLVGGQWVVRAWRELRVGDCVRLEADEVVPCDLVLLATSTDSGTAYTETMNLDGETNLKSRAARLETQRAGGEAVRGRVVCEPPNRNIYEFTAYLDLGEGPIPMSAGNMLLRGCVLRNTEWAVGVVAYAGADTKAMLNNSGAQSKRSRLEKAMNRETLFLAAMLGVLCAVGAIGMGVWLHHHDIAAIPYYGAGADYHGKAGEALLNFFSLIILLQILVPISLYISLELVRLFQALLMQQDLQLYYAPSDDRLKCRALNINEDLGQIRYIFSDKTGTLTQNRMVFHAASIGGVDYSHATRVEAAPLVPATVAPKDTVAPEIREALSSPGPAAPPPPSAWQPTTGAMVDARLLAALVDPQQGAVVRDFLLVLAACNTVVPTVVKRTAPATPPSSTPLTQGSFARRAFESPQVSSLGRAGSPAVQLEYQADSPDELAFVAAAAAYGFTLLERTSEAIVVDVQGSKERYEVLGVHEFDSSRKRMSVVVRCPDGSVRLLVKGADAALVPLLGPLYSSKGRVHSRRPSWDGHQPPLSTPGGHRRRSSREGDLASSLLSATQEHLDQYAREGLRTLLLAARTMPPEEHAAWASKYQSAATAMVGRQEALAVLAAETETGLQLLGATGIEDKLQEGVPECIALLRRAGLKVWVLTGDKQETAVSIAFSCQLLTDDMTPVVISGAASKEDCSAALASASKQYLGATAAKDGRWGSRRMSGSGGEYRSMDADRVSRLQQSSSSSGAAGVRARERTERWGENGAQGSSVAEAAGPAPRQLALVIDGQSLQYALTEELEDELFSIARACHAVVCCRVAPLQKAGVVSLMKRKARQMTLAIGDGANDVSMIQMADIGVGISGQEGRQAVMASDFAIAQFRFLGRLLLVHGHWCYQRLAYMVLYNFYKNAIFVFLLFWFILFTGWSSISALSSWNLVFFSLLYTSLPTIVVGVLDQDVSAATLLQQPNLYGVGQHDGTYNRGMFWATMADMLWQSLVLFFGAFFAFWRGSPNSLWEVGNLWCLAVTLTVTLHLAMDIYHWTWLHHAVIWLSLLITVVTMLILDAFPASQQYWVMYHAWGDARYWLTLVLVPLVCVLPRYLLKVARQWYWPTPVHVARAKQLAREGGGFHLIEEGGQQGATTPRTAVGHRNGNHHEQSKEEELRDYVSEVPPNGVPQI